MSAQQTEAAERPKKAIEVDPTRRLLTAEEVAAELGVSRFTVWRLRDAGRFPQPIKIGGSSRWTRADVDAFLIASRSTAGNGGVRKKGKKPGVRGGAR